MEEEEKRKKNDEELNSKMIKSVEYLSQIHDTDKIFVQIQVLESPCETSEIVSETRNLRKSVLKCEHCIYSVGSRKKGIIQISLYVDWWRLFSYHICWCIKMLKGLNLCLCGCSLNFNILLRFKALPNQMCNWLCKP